MLKCIRTHPKNLQKSNQFSRFFLPWTNGYVTEMFALIWKLPVFLNMYTILNKWSENSCESLPKVGIITQSGCTPWRAIHYCSLNHVYSYFKVWRDISQMRVHMIKPVRKRMDTSIECIVKIWIALFCHENAMNII